MHTTLKKIKELNLQMDSLFLVPAAFISVAEYGPTTPILFSEILSITGFKSTLLLLDNHDLPEEYTNALTLFACDCADRSPGAKTYVPVVAYLKALRGFVDGSVSEASYQAAREVIDEAGHWPGAMICDEGESTEEHWGFINWKSFWGLEWERQFTSFIDTGNGCSDPSCFDGEYEPQTEMLKAVLLKLEADSV